MVLRKILNIKAWGLDEISPVVWKTRNFDNTLLRYCNAVYNLYTISRRTKGHIPTFFKKGDLWIGKNYRSITLTCTAVKICNALLLKGIKPEIEETYRSMTSEILTIRRILKSIRTKKLKATLLFIDFYKAFDSIHRGKTEQILLAYGFPKETVSTIMMLHKNTKVKVKVRSADGYTKFFDIVAGVL